MRFQNLFQNPDRQISDNTKHCREKRISCKGDCRPVWCRATTVVKPWGSIRADDSVGGFTLIEVIAALVIVATALVSVLRLYALVSLNQLVRNNSLIAGNLLQQKMEEVKAIKRNNFSAIIADSVGHSYTGFLNYKLYVYETPNWQGKPYLKKVDVKGQWPFPGGGTSEETISTVVADY